ncbi:GntR family transcriptional regulator [Nocardioides sp. SOB77]|uniref:GntR family transcriptional regulator n=1 Tax=Nocardioides oceani TaxID=3058369 RepID=A0ABT8FDH8_9ACTN|nr:GntR family transcriptional regulator [Nocardioides oceani]MDN4172615.1 GntR family transcriptional regulator [Nocardioides oceani]
MSNDTASTTPATAAERAHTAIREAIVRGAHAPGTMLSENGLAAELGMSRTPVRAALARLQDEGWVTIYPQRGALVRELSETEVREAAQVRHALESAGVRRGETRLREALSARLTANVAEQERALSAGDVGAFTGLAAAFHRMFVEMSGNGVMLDVYDRLQARQYISIIRSADQVVGDPQQVLAEHRGLAEDAAAGDWAAFAERLDEHQARNHGLEAGPPPG